MKISVAITVLMVSCIRPASEPAIVTDVSESSVKVQQTWRTDPTTVDTVAEETCQLYGRSAKGLSKKTRTVAGNPVTDFLFACIDKPDS